MMHFNSIISVGLVFASFAVSQPILAQTYPSKPISLIVGYTPGGSTDLAARTIAPELSKRLGQPVLVDNTGGAGGQIGARKAVSAQPDGYTLLLGTSAEIAVAQHVSKAVKYNGLKDLTPIGLIGTQPMVLVGAPTVKAETTAQLLLQLKQNPGRLSYGSAGNASLPHLAGEYFKQTSSTFAVHIPYRGAAPMITDLLGGQVDLGMLVLSSAIGPIKAGRLKAYGTTEIKPTAQLPNTPPLAQTKGLEKYDISVFFGVFAPTQTDAAITSRLAQELKAVLADPAIVSKLTEAGFTVNALDPVATKAFVQKQEATYREIIKKSRINE
jgi:tripartite-type tricarboxylate transporter receptor subunit TctC